MKQNWLAALESVGSFIQKAPPDQVGCLYYSAPKSKFIEPDFSTSPVEAVPHYGREGGLYPIFTTEVISKVFNTVLEYIRGTGKKFDTAIIILIFKNGLPFLLLVR